MVVVTISSITAASTVAFPGTALINGAGSALAAIFSSPIGLQLVGGVIGTYALKYLFEWMIGSYQSVMQAYKQSTAPLQNLSLQLDKLSANITSQISTLSQVAQLFQNNFPAQANQINSMVQDMNALSFQLKAAVNLQNGIAFEQQIAQINPQQQQPQSRLDNIKQWFKKKLGSKKDDQKRLGGNGGGDGGDGGNGGNGGTNGDNKDNKNKDSKPKNRSIAALTGLLDKLMRFIGKVLYKLASKVIDFILFITPKIIWFVYQMSMQAGGLLLQSTWACIILGFGAMANIFTRKNKKKNKNKNKKQKGLQNQKKNLQLRLQIMKNNIRMKQLQKNVETVIQQKQIQKQIQDCQEVDNFQIESMRMKLRLNNEKGIMQQQMSQVFQNLQQSINRSTSHINLNNEGQMQRSVLKQLQFYNDLTLLFDDENISFQNVNQVAQQLRQTYAQDRFLEQNQNTLIYQMFDEIIYKNQQIDEQLSRQIDVQMSKLYQYSSLFQFKHLFPKTIFDKPIRTSQNQIKNSQLQTRTYRHYFATKIFASFVLQIQTHFLTKAAFIKLNSFIQLLQFLFPKFNRDYIMKMLIYIWQNKQIFMSFHLYMWLKSNKDAFILPNMPQMQQRNKNIYIWGNSFVFIPYEQQKNMVKLKINVQGQQIQFYLSYELNYEKRRIKNSKILISDKQFDYQLNDTFSLWQVCYQIVGKKIQYMTKKIN